MWCLLPKFGDFPSVSRLAGGKTVIALACFLAIQGYATAADLPNDKPQLVVHPAERTASALSTAVLGVAKAGKRIVSVGDHGAVLLSDDDGAHFRQAESVPIGSMLTAVHLPTRSEVGLSASGAPFYEPMTAVRHGRSSASTLQMTGRCSRSILRVCRKDGPSGCGR